MKFYFQSISVWLILLLPGFCNGQYSGGVNDGNTSAFFCGSNLNGSAASSISFMPLVGNSQFCSNSSDIYSETLSSGFADNIIWSLPAGSTIQTISSTPFNSVTVLNFGNTSGNITITAYNACSTVSSTPFAVSAVSCNNFTGGTNDGFTNTSFCANDLNGGISAPIVLNAISGASSFCSNSSERYSVGLSAGQATSFYWTSDSGSLTAQSPSSFTSSSVNLLMSNSDGSVIVTASNGCTSDSRILPVSATACGISNGGNNDGFSSEFFCGLDLNGGSSLPISLNPITGPATFCNNSTELYSVTLSAGQANSYYWTSTSGSITAQSVPSFTSNQVNILLNNTNGSVTVLVSNGCTSDTQTIPITANNCGMTNGGNDDGFSIGLFCGSDLTGTAPSAIVLNPISGPGTFCNSSAEGYAISLSSGFGSSYFWTAPGGAAIFNQNSTINTGQVTIQFASTPGNITVDVSNGCSTSSATLPVSAANCNQFRGGNNDGFSDAFFCSNTMNGGALAPITLNPISGGSSVFFNLGQNFSVTLASGNATTFAWTGPSGSNSPIQINTLTSSTALINMGAANGTVAVDVSNGCTSAQATLAVTGQNCPSFYGGIGDGFALPIELISFSAKSVDTYVNLEWVTASELNNDYYTVERSPNGIDFEIVTKVNGAGTTKEKSTYVIRDEYPYSGKSYYRLKQTDFSGHSTYSEIVSVLINDSDIDECVVYPNPTNNQSLTIKMKKVWTGQAVHITAHDPLDKIVMNFQITAGDRIHLKRENGIPVNPGIYIFVIQSGKDVVTRKVIIE